jgi:predicted nucleic acid-binding protein
MIVLDSSLLIAHLNPRDVHHARASTFMDRFLAGEWEEGILLEYVLLEVLTVIQAKVDHGAAVQAAEILLGARELLFVACSDIFRATLDTFRLEGRSGIGFADAAVVVAARQMAGGRVATFDRGFQGLPGVTVIPAG